MESINAWFRNIVETGGEAQVFLSNAAFIMMACKLINLRVKKLLDDKVTQRPPAGSIVRQMKEVSAELLKKRIEDYQTVSSLCKISDNFLFLDWRQGPSPKEIIHRLDQVFTDVNTQTKSGTTLRLSRSIAKNICFVAERNGHPMVMRCDNPVMTIHVLGAFGGGNFPWLYQG